MTGAADSARRSGVRFDPPDGPRVAALRRDLSLWYDAEKRDLPWRRTRDAYAIWVSEAMLQQTRVETVLGYWPRFLERFPTATALAEAEEEAVLEAWSGLGYYRRARSLQAAARVIAAEHGGAFPRDLDAALALPGVGPYTAGAVVSIAYDVRAPIVDGNVERVFSRLFALDGVRGSGPLLRAAWGAARALIAAEDDVTPRTWNQALMELGALICTPRTPSCEACPLAGECLARERGMAADLPRPKPKKQAKDVRLEVYVAERDGAWLLERRPEGRLMAGMWQFPTVETTATQLFPTDVCEALRAGLEAADDLFELAHGITNHRIRARVRAAEFSGEIGEGLGWFPVEDAASLALTGMAKKIARRLASAR